MKKLLTINEQLEEEQKDVSELIGFFEEITDLDNVIYEEWNAKDVLGHIASWHVSFSDNLKSAVKSRKPNPFKGSLTEVNERGVRDMARFTKEELLEKIKAAQTTIDENILNPEIKEIAYKKGSRDYSPIEHLEVVQRHINSHLKDLKGKCKIR